MTIMNAVNSIEFGRAFNNMLMRRLDDPVTLAQLMESEAYSDAQQEYDAIYEAVFSGDSVDAASIQALLNATRALHDMELDYLYRTGIQDGMLMLMPDFRTIGVE